MKAVFIIVGVLLLIGVSFLLWRFFLRIPSPSPNNDTKSQTKNSALSQNNAFMDLRAQALSFTSEQFEIDDSTSKPIVYGVIMDWNLGKGTATFVAFISGDASMYTSSGGGLIGGGGHENVRKATIALVEKGQNIFTKARKSDDISLPAENSVKFYFLTTNGRFIAEEHLQNFDNESSKWLDLFKDVNTLITELRRVSEDFEK
jgi:hypothetical protein